MTIDNKYNIEQLVILRTDIDKRERIITAIHVSKGAIEYELSQSAHISRHFEFELEPIKKQNTKVGFTSPR